MLPMRALMRSSNLVEAIVAVMAVLSLLQMLSPAQRLQARLRLLSHIPATFGEEH